uniref:Uncharacterized protein n=1 Tax=Leptospirillum ferrodiazotrophum TaxID=412449 RepID=C6HWE8_9BACT|nr:MAG: hypothetical protein UBAL3_80420076 [Leptospirillum ferrodiazotrophum]
MWGRCPGSGRWGRNPSGKAYRECGSDGGDFIVPALTVEEAPEGRTLTRTTSPKKDSELPCPSSIFCSGKDTGFLGEILLFTMIFPKKVKEGFEIALHLFPWRLPSRIVCSHWGRGRVGGNRCKSLSLIPASGSLDKKFKLKLKSGVSRGRIHL